MPAGCTTFWTSMESRTASKHIPVLTPIEWPIVFRITCCHSLARTSVLKQIVVRQFLTRGEEMGRLRKLTLAALALCILFIGVAAGQDDTNLPYRNTKLSPQERAADLVHRMTLEEKASQLVNQARAITRLNIPAYDWWSEALHGVVADGTTEFPEPIGRAATFDTPRIHEMATAIGTEGRIVHVQALQDGNSVFFRGLDFWAPNVNIFRDPRWGRGQETYGEDPFLSGRMAVAFVTGMQGDDPHYYRV